MKPILFNTEMARAILDGRKGVTRRLVKSQPKGGIIRHCGTWQETQSCANGLRVFTPPYQVGDILYVRESWAITSEIPGIAEDGPVYKADFAERELMHLKDKHFRWRPSIHMPKELARIFLKVTEVRAERLQDITGEEALLEGVAVNPDVRPEERERYYRALFVALWDTTTKPSEINKFGWDVNPWVWVIRYERIEKPEN